MSTIAEGDETAPFDRAAKLRQRARAAEACRQFYRRHLQSQPQDDGDISKPVLPYDYFHREVAQRLVERLDDINVRDEGFPLALEVGAGAEFVYDALVDGCDDDLMLELDDEENEYVGGRGGVRKLVQMDACKAMLHRDDAFADKTSGEGGEKSTICETYKLEADLDESPLPFPEGTFDLVVSSMSLHWINDLPRLLSEIKRVLKPDGCFLFALPGGNTLPELRSSLVLAELEREGGVSNHVGPYVDLSNVGSLLTGTGFRLPTIDIDDIHIGYPNAMVLMEHLARMGEGNASANRKDRVGLGTFLGAACLYRELYPAEEGKSGEGIVASAQVIYGIAWKEHESQQKPLDREARRKAWPTSLLRKQLAVNSTVTIHCSSQWLAPSATSSTKAGALSTKACSSLEVPSSWLADRHFRNQLVLAWRARFAHTSFCTHPGASKRRVYFVEVVECSLFGRGCEAARAQPPLGTIGADRHARGH